ncbi:MAG: DNA repair exonuclease [bacterium]|nr:DNA repair exonuclease [bacterium]
MTKKKVLTFIHTADWHIGYPFSPFDPDKRKELRRAIFRTVELVFRYAQKMEIPLILCAGNIVDNGQLCAKEDIYKCFDIIKKYPATHVVMTAGNHDPLINRNIYSLIDKKAYPENLSLVEEDEELPYPEWNVNIFAASIREKNGDFNPLNWIKGKKFDKDKINIGLCHGSITNETSSGNDFPIQSDFALTHGLDYLALGGWHSFKKINQRIYYPGVPEPLQFDHEGYPLKVEIHGPGGTPVVEPIKNVSQYRWSQSEETITGDSFQEFKAKLERTGEKEIRQLTVSGSLPLDHYKTYHDFLEMNRHRYFDIRDHVVIQPGDQTLPELVDGYMAEVVNRLLDLKKSGKPLPEEFLNPYVSIERTEVHKQADRLKSTPQQIIDKALLKIYTYVKEKGQ